MDRRRSIRLLVAAVAVNVMLGLAHFASPAMAGEISLNRACACACTDGTNNCCCSVDASQCNGCVIK
ncbi:MAG TPA: hypothetical protein VN706_16455 [Gemmatimonadaceae bacterium]|nr:hypothetical protein [Gemmatimonadaceae bacterium]